MLDDLTSLSQFFNFPTQEKRNKMASPIIKFIDWNVNETTCSLMKNSNVGNVAINNFITKKRIELETPSFVSKYSIDTQYDLKIKIHSDEVCFDKFEEFEQFIIEMDKSALFMTENKKKSIYCPMIIKKETPFINFSICLQKVEIVDKDDISLLNDDISKRSNDDLKLLLPPKTKMVVTIKIDYLYNNRGKFGVKRSISKIMKLE